MCPMFVTECFYNKCFKLSTLHSVYISPGCESDMILSVMTLRNAWGECRGVTSGVVNPSAKGSSGMSGEGSTGRRGSLPLRMFILLISLSSSNKSCEQSMLETFH